MEARAIQARRNMNEADATVERVAIFVPDAILRLPRFISTVKAFAPPSHPLRANIQAKVATSNGSIRKPTPERGRLLSPVIGHASHARSIDRNVWQTNTDEL